MAESSTSSSSRSSPILQTQVWFPKPEPAEERTYNPSDDMFDSTTASEKETSPRHFIVISSESDTGRSSSTVDLGAWAGPSQAPVSSGSPVDLGFSGETMEKDCFFICVDCIARGEPNFCAKHIPKWRKELAAKRKRPSTSDDDEDVATSQSSSKRPMWPSIEAQNPDPSLYEQPEMFGSDIFKTGSSESHTSDSDDD